jgi:Tol biopolymer transport system component
LYRVGFRSANPLKVSLVTTAAMLAICLLALVETTNTAEAEDSLPHNGKIAFGSTRSGEGALYTVEPDGSNLNRFTDSRYPLGQPSWSPDGTRIAFAGDTITVMDADGSHRRDLLTYPNRLGSYSSITDITWSPDGTKLIFSSGRSPNYIHDIYTIEPDGSNLMNLTNTPKFDEMEPDFSPNGSQIGYYRGSTGPTPPYGVYVMNADGSDPTLLSEGGGFGQVDWSPHGMELVFESIFESADSDAEYGDEEVYVINADGSGQRTALTSNSAVDLEPDWSPDGKKIAFSSDRDGDFDIYTMDADGSNVAQLTNSPGDDKQPDWLPRLPKDADGSDEAQVNKKPGVEDVDRDRPELTVIVKPGDSLWSISEQRLGPEASPQRVYDHTIQMYDLNRKRIGADPNLIFPGQRLSLPPPRYVTH